MHPGTQHFQSIIRDYFNELFLASTTTVSNSDHDNNDHANHHEEKKDEEEEHAPDHNKSSMIAPNNFNKIVFNPKVYKEIIHRVPLTSRFYVRDEQNGYDDGNKWKDITTDKCKLIRMVGESWRREKFFTI